MNGKDQVGIVAKTNGDANVNLSTAKGWDAGCLAKALRMSKSFAFPMIVLLLLQSVFIGVFLRLDATSQTDSWDLESWGDRVLYCRFGTWCPRNKNDMLISWIIAGIVIPALIFLGGGVLAMLKTRDRTIRKSCHLWGYAWMWVAIEVHLAAAFIHIVTWKVSWFPCFTLSSHANGNSSKSVISAKLKHTRSC